MQPTSAEVVDDGGGGSVVDNVGTVIEVVQVVTAVEASETEDMVQHQILVRL